MNVTNTSQETTERYTFDIELDGVKYYAVIWLSKKGKFIDDEISYDEGEELEYEGEEGDIREKIINYLDANWDTLTK